MSCQRLSGRWNYYITRWRQEVSKFWRSESLVIRCSRESQHPAESWASGWAALENEKDTTLMVIRVGVNILQFCSASNSLSHTTFQIKWEVYFSKRLCRSSLLCRYDSVCICIYAYRICLYSLNHGHGYTTFKPFFTIQYFIVLTNFPMNIHEEKNKESEK